MIELFKQFFLFLFPLQCVSCGSYGDPFCPDCESKLKIYEPNKCFVCDKACKQNLHNNCKKKAFIDELIIIFDKNRFSQNLIYNLKFNFNKSLSKIIAYLIYLNINRSFKNNCLFTSVPIHFTKNNIRGYNQSELIAIELAHYFQIPFYKLLKRIISGKDQKFKTKAERQHSIHNVFSCTNLQINWEQFDTIILVDDILTTGSTLFECAKKLKEKYQNKRVIAIAFQHG